MTRRTVVVALAVVIAGAIITFIVTGTGRDSMPINGADATPPTELTRRLRAHVEFLASPQLAGRKPGTPGHQQAAHYVEDAVRQLGLEPLPSLRGYRQPVSAILGDNLIAIRRPTAESSRGWILIGAHYDHLGGHFLGADDNASAVAILLETARALPALRHHPVAFVAFNTEEAPYIRTPYMGSQYFLDHLPSEIGTPGNFHAVIIMDLMGGAHWTPLHDTIFAAGAEMSPRLYRRIKEVARVGDPPSSRALDVRPVGLHLVEEIPLMGRVAFSDYDAFRNAGVPFLFLSAGRTPRYHKPTDLPDTLQYERMAATVLWLRDVIEALDQDGDRYAFEPTRIEFADEVESFRPLVTLAADPATAIPGTSGISLWKLKQDREWLHRLDPAKASTDDVKRLERLSIRMQCLLADFPGCFLF